ncbi:N-acetylmuramoyl-L-alanine amidase [Seleniivibrio woodruffii]|uniref:N-acetylmuramoyl-L-alanine amidase n=1 Tax=Seleniivibrio woodruffii TaxID=1078050 RepID=A0A4R1KB07_9BACT|nr:N-acetylmuramoyl-L-alanine amidase [Seleniivibrio woodruffii]TCK61718.1 N-acetylmuramoyl-L-alanine amidase [Seleniivibrio woodruffii]TVZ35167.1 N-acetylmuramoyl-L-alanine amidase [Seleniivibrio woodruffii]
MKKILILLLVLFSCFALFADDVDEYNSAKRDFDYIERSDKVTRRSYVIVADKFYKIYASAPKADLGDDSLHYAAQTYYRSYMRYANRDDLLKALRYWRILSSNYDTVLASKAFLQSAKIYEDQKDYPSAQFMLRKLIARFPRSEDAAEARSKLDGIDAQFASKTPTDRIQRPSLQPKPPIKAETVAYQPKEEDTADKAQSANRQTSFGDINSNVKATDGKAAVKRIRYFTTPDYTRVVMDLTGKVEFDKHWLKADPSIQKPPRLFIDLNNVVISPDIPQDIEIKDGLLRSLRWAYNRPGVARVVLDSDNVQDFTVFAMPDPDRLVIDVSNAVGSPKPPVHQADSRPSTPAKNEVASSSPVPAIKGTGSAATLASVFGLKIRSIVIDPGHGGKDPGASYYGVKEKDVVLDIGKELYAQLKEAYPNIDVYMTRNTDVFIPLEERTAFANRKKADLFVSIHINAAPNKSARGVETYVLNVTNDKRALAVAALENQTTQKSMSDLQGILKDLMMNSKLEESLQLASYVQKNLHANLYTDSRYNLGVKQAPFYVLVGAMMPSILVEAGFVSNQDEADNLTKESYRKEIAKGVFQGITSYIKQFNGN